MLWMYRQKSKLLICGMGFLLHTYANYTELTFDALDWRMRSLLSNWALYFFKFFRISCCCFWLSNIGRRGLHWSEQNDSLLNRFKIFPWNDQIQKPVSTWNPHKNHWKLLSQNWNKKYILYNMCLIGRVYNCKTTMQVWPLQTSVQ